MVTDTYVSQTTIQIALGCHIDKAKEIFAKAKEIEKEKNLIDPRPQAVQAKTVLEVTGLNYSFIKKQYQERVALRESITRGK